MNFSIKNFNLSTDWFTSVLGLVTTVLSVLVGLGVISLTETDIHSVEENVTSIYGGVMGLVMMFGSKDGK